MTLWVISSTQLNLTNVPFLTARKVGRNSTSATATVFGRGAAAAGARASARTKAARAIGTSVRFVGSRLLFGFAFTRTEPRMNGWILQKYVYVLPRTALRRGGVEKRLEPVVTSWLKPPVAELARVELDRPGGELAIAWRRHDVTLCHACWSSGNALNPPSRLSGGRINVCGNPRAAE